jgi:hypothetical protein
MTERDRNGQRKKRKPKFRVGQVVSVRSFYGNFHPGETGPGFEGKHGWRHGFQFGKIVKVLPNNGPPLKPSSPHCYFLDGWMSAQAEDDLRAITRGII